MLGRSEMRTFLLLDPRGYDNASQRYTQQQPLLIRLTALNQLHFNCWLFTAF